jgi:hypothetical protein
MSSEERIRDRGGITIGYIITESNGDQRIQGADCMTLGYYFVESNTTTDSHYSTIGEGNQLMRLLK